MRSHALLALLVSGLGLGAIMCSSSDPEGDPSHVQGDLASGRFRGVLSGSGDVSGVLEITATAADGAAQSLRPRAVGASSQALSGTLTLNLPGFGAVTVTGSLDLASNTATFQGTAAGGAVSFTGTYVAGVIRGTATLPTGPAVFEISNEALGVATYCGSFSGGSSGRWSMIAAGNQIGAVFVGSDGRSGRGSGTIDGSLVTITLDPAGSATGNLSAGRIDGSWSHAGSSGSFATSESTCRALTPAGTGPDGGDGDGGTDGGFVDGGSDGGDVDGGGEEDGGALGAPETIYTVAGDTNVSHLAIASQKIFYALDHAYFSQRATIGSVGTDGSSPTTILPTNVPPDETRAIVGGLTATGSRVFYVAGTDPPGGSDAKLLSLPIAGGTVTDHGAIGGPSNRDYVNGVSRIVNDGMTIFVSYDSSSNDGLRTYDANGTSGAQLMDLVGPTGLGVDGNDLYFGDFGGLERVTKTLGASPALFSDKSEFGQFDIVVNVAFDADNVYFVSNTTNASGVWRKPKSGGAIAPVIASTPARIRGLAVMGGHLYFASIVSGGGQQGAPTATLQRVPSSATNATATAIGPANPYDVVTDGTYVYWGNARAIQRLHK